MKSARWHHALRVLLVMGLMLAPVAVFSYQGPRLQATYTVSSVRPTAGAVDVTFSFNLENLESTDTYVERIDLASLSDAESSFASFSGGTLAALGSLRGSAVATIPQAVFDRWQSGGPATLFVYTRTAYGNLRRNRVDAYRVTLLP